MKNKVLTVRNMSLIALLSVIATLVMLLEFPLWFAPGFYMLDLSEVVVLIGAFALGPIAGVIIEFIKILLNFLINGSITGGIGELANFLIGCSFIAPASIVYQKRKTLKGAVVGLTIGTLLMAIAGGLVNYYVLLPLYSTLMGYPISAFVEMGTKVNGLVKDTFTLIVFATMPFNIVKGIISSVITLIIYKKVSAIIKKQ